ncbi:MAG: hypothetical protein QXR48_03075, partial [Candidatus Woesearchaeota archaeon]
ALASVARSHQHKKTVLLAGIGFAALLVLGIISYLVIIYPVFVREPVLAKPKLIEPVRQEEFSGGLLAGTAWAESQKLQAAQEALPAPETAPEEIPVESVPVQEAMPASATVPMIDEKHIAYLLTQMGMYKLHPNPFTGALPQIEIFVSDLGKTFSAVVQDNEVIVNPCSAVKPDARITVTQDAITDLLAAENSEQFKVIAAKLFNEREQRGFKGELIAGQTDLLLKGYLALYKEAKDAMPTGLAVSDVELVGWQVVGMFVIVVVLWGVLLLRMALYR